MMTAQKLVEMLRKEGEITPSMGSANGGYVAQICADIVEKHIPSIIEDAERRGFEAGWDDRNNKGNFADRREGPAKLFAIKQGFTTWRKDRGKVR